MEVSLSELVREHILHFQAYSWEIAVCWRESSQPEVQWTLFYGITAVIKKRKQRGGKEEEKGKGGGKAWKVKEGGGGKYREQKRRVGEESEGEKEWQSKRGKGAAEPEGERNGWRRQWGRRAILRMW